MELSQKRTTSLLFILSYCTVIITTVLLFLHHYTQSAVYAYLGLVSMLIPVFFMDTKDCTYLLLFYIPNIRMYKFETGNTLVGFLIIAIFFKICIWEQKRIGTKELMAILGMLGVVLANIVVVGDKMLLMSFLRFAMGYMIIAKYMSVLPTGENFDGEYEKLRNHFSAGCVSMLLCGILFYVLKGKSLLDGRFLSVNNDPNFFALTMGVAVSFLLVDITFNKKATVKAFLIVLFLFFGGLLSVSRGFLISVSINLILVLYIFLKGKTLKTYQKFLLLCLILCVAFLCREVIENVIESFSTRFNDSSMENQNGRADINALYLNAWKKTLRTILFGLGDAKYWYSVGVTYAVHHNYYVQLLTSLGVCGVLAMMNLYRVMYKKIVGNLKRVNVLMLFPMITYAVMLLTLPALFGDSHLFIIMLIFAQYRRFQGTEERVS